MNFSERIDQELNIAAQLGSEKDIDLQREYDPVGGHIPSEIAISEEQGGQIFGCVGIRPYLPPNRFAKIQCIGNGSKIFIGNDLKIRFSIISIEGENNTIIIGPNCKLLDIKIRVGGRDKLIVIGAGTTWEGGMMLNSADDELARAIVIGNDCMISNDVNLRTADGHSLWDAGGSDRIDRAGNIIVGHHVWLGNGSRIAKGSTIGNGAVLGQRSFLSGHMEPYAAYAGVPARKIRDRVEWSRTTDYQDIPERYRYNEPEEAVIPTRGFLDRWFGSRNAK